MEDSKALTQDRAVVRLPEQDMQREPGLKLLALVIEDDPAIRRLLHVGLEGTEFRIAEAETAADGLDQAVKKRPDIVLLDIGLPDAEGLRVVEVIRTWSNVPILMVSAKGEENLKVKALELGADDYITKPFGVSELLARMRVAVRHATSGFQPSGEPVFESGNLKVDLSSREVRVGNERIQLTPLEFKLLAVLVKHAGKVVTHRQLLTEVWGAEYAEEAQYLRVYMGYLRKKLEANPNDPRILLTEPRVGYRLAV